MNYFAWTGLINGIVATVCGLMVVLQNPREKRNRIMGCWFLSVGSWMYFYCVWLVIGNADNALFWCRVLMMGAIFIPATTYHTSLVMFGLETPKRRLFLKINYVISFLLAASNFTPLFITHVQQQMFFPYWPMPGPAMHVYTLFLFFVMTKSLLLIFEYRKKAPPVVRNEILWFGVAIACGYGGGGINICLWYDIPIPPYFNFCITVYMLLSGLLFFRLGLLDFRLFFRDTTVHVVSNAILGGTTGFILYLFIKNPAIIPVCIALFIVVPLLYRPFHLFIQKAINRTKLGGIDKYLTSVDTNIGMLRESSFNYDDLARNLVHAVLGTFPVDLAAVYFWDEMNKFFQLRAQMGMKSDLSLDLKYNRTSLAVLMDDPLVEYMKTKQALADREIFEAVSHEQGASNILNALRRIEAEVCAPFFLLGQLKGFLVVGPKKDKGIFHKKDLDALQSYQRIGEDIMRYIIGMEHEIRHAALYSHDMNNDTKALVQTLQFLGSPLISGVSQDKIKKILKQAEDVAVRLNQSFQLNRDRSALILKSIRGEYDCKNEDLVQLIKESFGKFTIRADESKITFRCHVPDKNLHIYANAGDTIRVLDNLISNAFRYVDAGGKVTVEILEDGETADIVVSDDGIGIDPGVIEHIWDFGWQVKNSKEGASGLGLALVKQIVDLHGWKISVGRNPKGKGTRFAIEIPLLNENTKEKAA